jgi:hypothetical protein
VEEQLESSNEDIRFKYWYQKDTKSGLQELTYRYNNSASVKKSGGLYQGMW